MNILTVQMEPSRSGWYAALGPRPSARTLTTDVSCDYLVVGGGWMGLHCARRLGELAPEARVVLVDAGRIGDGTGVARGTAFGKALAELALGKSSRSIDILNKRPKPNRSYPAWITEIGVQATTSYRFFRAGKET
jgi:choline dehydrogenase-like flavoprotein